MEQLTQSSEFGIASLLQIIKAVAVLIGLIFAIYKLIQIPRLKQRDSRSFEQVMGYKKVQRCRVPNCELKYSYHRHKKCCFCHQEDPDHLATNCQSRKQIIEICLISKFKEEPQERCKVSNCFQQHTQHLCRYCGNIDSDHQERQCSIRKQMKNTTNGNMINSLRLSVFSTMRIDSSSKMKTKSQRCATKKSLQVISAKLPPIKEQQGQPHTERDIRQSTQEIEFTVKSQSLNEKILDRMMQKIQKQNQNQKTKRRLNRKESNSMLSSTEKRQNSQIFFDD